VTDCGYWESEQIMAPWFILMLMAMKDTKALLDDAAIEK
jgi:hypothetical protein